MAHLASIKSLTFKAKDRWHRVGHNTKFFSASYNTWSLMYHGTNVVQYSSTAQRLRVSTGGWMTKTTAERICHGLAYFGLTLLTNDLPGRWRVADAKGNAWTIRGTSIVLVKNNATGEWQRSW